jgi:hypothetical protein
LGQAGRAGRLEKRQIVELIVTGRQSVRQQNGTESFRKGSSEIRSRTMHILWLILIGFVAGVIAKFLHPGSSNEPSGFILTTLLGIAGSFVAVKEQG